MRDVTQEQVGMPLEDFVTDFRQQPFELINGEKIIIMPGVAGPNYVSRLLFLALVEYLVKNPIGEVFYEMTFVLPNGLQSNWVKGSRTPDIMVMGVDQLGLYRAQTPDWKERPYALIPLLVVEIVSPNDDYRNVDDKVDLYLTDGVAMIWVLDPQRKKGRVYTASGEQRLSGDVVLSGGEVLPGFEISLSALFA